MEKLIRGLHHVTATVTGAQDDLDFYGRALGMRLVKKTVNFDNHNVYHFYYGDELGTPGTLMTTFPYRGWGVREGRHGAGQIVATSFSVPDGVLDEWKRRLNERGLSVSDAAPRFGDDVVTATDPSGLTIELIASGNDDRAPWTARGLDENVAVRGLHSVTMSIREPARTLQFLTDVLDFEVVNESEGRTRLAVNGDRPGHVVDVAEAADAPDAANGLGTVHHVAFAVSDVEEQLRMREELIRLGYQVTPVMDRQYFRSIYFREPGGVLFEIATVPPGFTVDEDVGALGLDLKLPPWEEQNRKTIEEGLDTVSY